MENAEIQPIRITRDFKNTMDSVIGKIFINQSMLEELSICPNYVVAFSYNIEDDKYVVIGASLIPTNMAGDIRIDH